MMSRTTELPQLADGAGPTVFRDISAVKGKKRVQVGENRVCSIIWTIAQK